MERKIGEIFEFNGEWYQCVKSPDGSCKHCDMNFEGKCPIPIKECTESGRSDKSYVIFKKLEKVGEPFPIVGKLYQYYKVFDIDNVCGDGPWCVYNYKAKTLTIEIKQNKEDMKEDNNPNLSNSENIGKNLKPFDLQAAKSGKPVCTRDGRKARIICFDRKDIKPIVALVTFINDTSVIEKAFYYFEDGHHLSKNDKNIYDLMMLPEKKEGWVNIYNTNRAYYYMSGNVFKTKDEAMQEVKYEIAIGQVKEEEYASTIKISWEE